MLCITQGGAGVKPPEAGGFFNLNALKWLKIGTKHLKNAKIDNANLYYNFSRRFLKTYFSTGGPVRLCPPLAFPPHRIAYVGKGS